MTNNQPFTPYIIGIGPGDAAYIYPLAQKLIEQAEVLIGGRRNLAELARPGQETLVIDRGLAQVAEYIRANWQSRRLVVLASGDTSLFSVRAYLQKSCRRCRLACCRALALCNICWPGGGLI